MSKKIKVKVYESSKAKKLIAASLVAAAAVSVVGVTEQENKAEAAMTEYYTDGVNKFSVTQENKYLTVRTLEGIQAASVQLFSYSMHEERYIPIETREMVNGVVEFGGMYMHPLLFVNGNELRYVSNSAPTTPTLTVPSIQFEHGDKHIIGWEASDADNDSITYTLEATYNDGSTWETLYTGPNRSYQYIVPNDKGTSVQFKVTASDGKTSTTSAVSAVKSIREVMYYWNKYNNVENPIWKLTPAGAFGETSSFDYLENLYSKYSINSDGTFSASPEDRGPRGSTYKYFLSSENYRSHGTGVLRFVFEVTTLQAEPGAYNYAYRVYTTERNGVTDSIGTLAQGNIQASANGYVEGVKNQDGYWYVRGQRVLSEDVTPPIIELTEQSEYGATSTVNVKTHDLGQVSTVKWAQGERAASYFASNGTTISGTQTNTGGSFTVSANGIYSVYAVDNKGNTVVQTIEVKKVNTAPTMPTLTIPTVQFEHDDKHIFSWNATDPQNDPITYTLQASYDNGEWENLYTGTAKTFEYLVPENKGTNVKFRVVASDGMFSATSAESAAKSIREVMYYWNKFRIMSEIVWHSRVENIPLSAGYEVFEARLNAIYNNSTYRNVWNYQTGQSDWFILYDEPQTITNQQFIETLQAGYNAYPHKKTHSDGYWYERGQRVLAEDVTPPIIELTEQSDYGITSTVNVKTHDLGKVATVKWAKGEQPLSFFTTNGTSLPGTQTSEGSNFTASENGIYTVYAVDNKGNAAVQTIEVKNINLPSEIQVVSGQNKFDVVDNAKSVSLQGAYADRENDDVTTTAKYNGAPVGTGSGSNGSFTVDVKPNSIANGVHDNPFEVTANDGYADSPAVRTTNHIVIKVDDANDYLADLNGHTSNAEDFTVAQHEAFYNAYTAVLAYENRTGTKADVDTAIAALKMQTGITESDTLTDWESRTLLMEATLSVENAESKLEKADFEQAKGLVSSLNDRFETISSSDNMAAQLTDLTDRVEELERYHTALDAVTILETEVAKPVAERDANVISWSTINAATALINVVENTTNKAALKSKLNQVIFKFVNSKTEITSEDLSNLTEEEVHIHLEAIYDEYKEEFKDLTVHASALIKFVNGLHTALSSMRQAEVDAFNTMFAGMAPELQAKPNLIAVKDMLNELLTYRTGVVTNETIETAINGQIASIPFATTAELMTLVSNALKEVYEYNTVDFNEEHSDIEKGEGQTAVSQLNDSILADGHFQTDMQAYLDNGIPVVNLTNGVYAYITDGALVINGTVRDENHSSHTVEVTYNGVTERVSTGVNGGFEVSFTLTEAGYQTHELFISADDGLTEKKVSFKSLPIFNVSDIALFTRFAEAIEKDHAITFDQISPTVAAELYEIFADVQSHTPFNIMDERKLLNRAETFSGQPEGALETLIKSLIASEYFKWLIDNYSTATVDDFHMVGVTGVTYDNIVALKAIMDDYVVEHTKDPIPLLPEYEAWIELIGAIQNFKDKVSSADNLTTTQAVNELVEELETAISEIPNWVTEKADLSAELEALKNAKAAMAAVEQAESSYEQADVDAAHTLVNALPDSLIKDALNDRLDYLQTVVDTIALVVQAETTKDESDITNATAAVAELSDDEPMKQQLQDRLAGIAQLLEAEEAVLQAEMTQTQSDKDNAQALVDALPDGSAKDALQERLDDLQGILDELLAEENAGTAITTAEDTWADEDIQSAQDLIDVVADGAAKDALQERLDSLKGLVDDYKQVVNLVEAAESSKTDADFTTAQSALEQLLTDHSSTGLVPNDRTEKLQDRLDELAAYIAAEKLVSQAETSLDETDIQTAKAAVAALTDSPNKESLKDRLAALDQLGAAIDAVEQAEATVSQVDVDKAKDLVDLLPDGQDKENLLDRLETVQDAIDKKNADEKAEDAVEKAENTWDAEDIAEAGRLVEELQDGEIKDHLKDRLEQLETVLDNYEKAAEATEKAEQSLTKEDAENAQALIDSLPSNSNKDALQERLDVVHQYIAAEKAVERAESLKTQGTKDYAQSLVDALPDSEAKQELQVRLDALQQVIDEKASDLLDKLIDDPYNVTDQELADYVQPETVYEELMDEYIDKIVEQGDALTKEHVIQIVRLINSYELAKLSMESSYIAAYQQEYEAAKALLSVSEYPTPTFLSKVEEYKGNNAVLAELIAMVAAETGMSEADVQEQLDQIRTVSEEAQLGTFTVEYRLADGTVIHSKELEAEYGEVTVTGELEGYEIIGENTFTFELSEETEGQVVSFNVEEAQMGTFTIQYSLADGTVIKEEERAGKYGEIEVLASLTGFNVVGDNRQLFTLDATTEGKIINFIVEPVEETGSYTLRYKTLEGEVILETTQTDIPYGEVTFDHQLEKYTVTSGDSAFVLTADTDGSVFEFIVEPIELEEQPEDEQTSNPADEAESAGSYTVEYRLSDETVVSSKVVQVNEFGTFTVESIFEGTLENYVLVEGQQHTQSVTISEDEPEKTVVFYVEPSSSKIEDTPSTSEKETVDAGLQEEVTETESIKEEALEASKDKTSIEVVETNESSVTETNSTVNQEVTEPTAHSGMMTVASIDDLVLSFAAAVNLVSEGQPQYIAKAFYSLEGLKTAIALEDDLSTDYLDKVKSYIISSLEDGAYKEYLLAGLGIVITDLGNGNDGMPDLTPVAPTPKPKPPVVEPTPEPPIIENPTPPVVVNPTPPVVNPTPPVDKGDQDVAGDSDEKENTVTHEVKDNEQHWKLENPSGNSYTFKGEGISITIPLDGDVELVEVGWIHLGKQHYQLKVKFDGKQITSFKEKVVITKEHNVAYLVRGKDGQYEAMPYTYKGRTFTFGTKQIETPFYFSTTKRTFQDIDGLYSKDAVEELASRYIVQGTTKTTYSPYANITRSQFSVMIARALALEPTENQSFKDTQRHWAKDEIQALVELGVVKGINENRFDPAGSLTRQQAALMIYRLLQSQGVELPKAAPDFLDNDKLKGEAAEAAGALQALGIFEGTKGYFNPYDKLTRAQMAKVLKLSLELTGSY